MKSFIRFLLVLGIICYGFLGSTDMSKAQSDSIQIKVGDTPQDILKAVYKAGKKDGTINSQFNDLTRRTGFAQCGSSNKICMAVESIRLAISPYVNFAVFVVLAIATILIIYNGFNLVIGKGTTEELTQTKAKITNIVTGIVIISGFVIIIRILMSIVVMVTG